MQDINDFVVSTTSTLEGWVIDEYLGVVSVRRMAGVRRSDPASSGESGNSTRQYVQSTNLTSIDDDILILLKKRAAARGANGLVGVRIDYEEITGQGAPTRFLVRGVGTAVRLLRNRPALDADRTSRANGRVESSDLQEQLERRQYITSARTGELEFTPQVWQFLIDHRVHELASQVLREVARVWQERPAEDRPTLQVLRDRAGAYFGAIPDTEAADALYRALRSPERTGYLDLIIDLTADAGLVDLRRIKSLLETGPFEARKRALELLLHDPPSYERADIDRLAVIRRVVDLVFEERCERFVKELEYGVQEMWRCECGAEMEVDEAFCRNCGKDCRGFRSDETRPEKVVSLLEKKLEILEERLR